MEAIRLKQGTVRDDGMIFWSYASHGGEWWITETQFIEFKLRDKDRRDRIRSEIRDNIAKNGMKKRGQERDDGMVFWGYSPSHSSGEKWVAKDKFGKLLASRKETNRKWNTSNSDKMTELKRAWDKRNPDRVKETQVIIGQNRRARKRANGVRITKNEISELRAKSKGKCFYCREKKKLTLDHVTPLKLGGRNEASNIVMACLNCNSRKQAKDPIRYAREIGLLLI